MHSHGRSLQKSRRKPARQLLSLRIGLVQLRAPLLHRLYRRARACWSVCELQLSQLLLRLIVADALLHCSCCMAWFPLTLSRLLLPRQLALALAPVPQLHNLMLLLLAAMLTPLPKIITPATLHARRMHSASRTMTTTTSVMATALTITTLQVQLTLETALA